MVVSINELIGVWEEWANRCSGEMDISIVKWMSGCMGC